MKKIRFVCATRVSRAEFYTSTALGKSMILYGDFPAHELELYPNNTSGLPAVYNAAIVNAERDPAVLVFIHDDVHICDFYWPSKIHESIERFDVVGVAGGKTRVARQYSWRLFDDLQVPDADAHSGIVGHGRGFPCGKLLVYGPSGQECKLLDGLMLIADSETLVRSQLRFDPLFTFHFYDLDFCRQAEVRGLRIGTWPISVVHESGGSFRSDAWKMGYQNYLKKYND